MSRNSLRIFVVVLLWLTACVEFPPEYPNAATAPAEDRMELQKVEDYYISKAKEKAAFGLRCPAEQITMQVVSRKPGQIYLTSRTAKYGVVVIKAAELIATIGADGCGARAAFEVVCGPGGGHYGQLANPCDVVASTEAEHAIGKK
jgi:hypothetical protein